MNQQPTRKPLREELEAFAIMGRNAEHLRAVMLGVKHSDFADKAEGIANDQAVQAMRLACGTYGVKVSA